MWACEHWNFYVYGHRFTLVTDHQALKTLLTAAAAQDIARSVCIDGQTGCSSTLS